MKKIIFIWVIISFSINLGICQTIWSGPPVIFTKPDGADWTLPEFQDSLTPSVILARQELRSLFNIVLESEYNRETDLSPLDTEWAIGNTSDLSTLTFDTWQNANGRNKPNVGEDLVLHLISDDIYIDLKYLSWSGGGNGGYSYIRSSNLPLLDIEGTIKIENIDTVSNTDYYLVVKDDGKIGVQNFSGGMSIINIEHAASNKKKHFYIKSNSTGNSFSILGEIKLSIPDTVTNAQFGLVATSDSLIAAKALTNSSSLNESKNHNSHFTKSSSNTSILLEIDGNFQVGKLDTVFNKNYILVLKPDGTVSQQLYISP